MQLQYLKINLDFFSFKSNSTIFCNLFYRLVKVLQCERTTTLFKKIIESKKKTWSWYISTFYITNCNLDKNTGCEILKQLIWKALIILIVFACKYILLFLRLKYNYIHLYHTILKVNIHIIVSNTFTANQV